MESIYYYDIESLWNAFILTVYMPPGSVCRGKKYDNGHAEVYYLWDNPELVNMSDHEFRKKAAQRIREKNTSFKGSIVFCDLKDRTCLTMLARLMGASKSRLVNSQSTRTEPYRIICDTDPEYEAAYAAGEAPYLAGYNSSAYDTVMLAFLFSKTLFRLNTVDTDENGEETVLTKPELRRRAAAMSPVSGYSYIMPDEDAETTVTAKQMRLLNNILFSNVFHSNMPSALYYGSLSNMSRHLDDVEKNVKRPSVRSNRNCLPAVIHRNMRLSGRHLDIALIPGKRVFLAEKRVLGMLGYQILESDQLDDQTAKIENADQLCDLLAYNFSDCSNLEHIFYHPAYISNFELKRELLHTYKELTYKAIDDTYNKRNAELPVQLDGNGHYDDEHHAYSGYAPDVNPENVRPDRVLIDSTSARLAAVVLCPYGRLHDIPTVSYMYPDERNAKALGIKPVDVLEQTKAIVEKYYAGDEFKQARADFENVYQYYDWIRGKNFDNSEYYNSVYDWDHNKKFRPHDISNASEFAFSNNTMPYYGPDGKPTSCFVNWSIGGIHGAEYNKALYEADLKAYKENPAKVKEPHLFTRTGSTGSAGHPTKLNTRYAYTSCDPVNHDDFSSYYPNLLRMMGAYWNTGLGYDRYGLLYERKQKLGKLMKDKSYSKDQRAVFKRQRAGTKLILNSASGASDAAFDNSIRMNNRIISMRIIGQLFTYSLGLIMSVKGGKVTSTNTDGLYAVMDPEINDRILVNEAKRINVPIEPERMYLISKDSNNRIEADDKPDGLHILGAGGGTVGCRMGADPGKSLNHAAVIDWGLAEYLCRTTYSRGPSIFDDMNRDIATEILQSARNGACVYRDDMSKDAAILSMFQIVTASNPASYSYIFAVDDDGESHKLQRFNRCFIMKSSPALAASDHICHLQIAAARMINAEKFAKKTAEINAAVSEAEKQKAAFPNDRTALKILAANGLSEDSLLAMTSPHRQAVVEKVTDIDPEWYILIENHSLAELEPEYRQWILNNLDLDKYVEIMAGKFDKNWKNIRPKRTAVQLAMAI